MKFKKTQVAVAVASVLGLLVTSVQAQTSATTDPAAERVTVTGSNIKRSAKEGTSPIETITAADIKASGAKTVLELMKMVPSIGADGYNDTPGQNGFSRGVATASLRALGATSTLILLNGRRMTPSAYANPNNGTSTLYDLNSIPVSAIERVEIFKDGASAVYGSDAIGGVINFITKNDYRGMEAGVRVGANDDGEFAKRTATITAGFGDFKTDGFNILVSADFTQRDATSLKNGSNDIQADQYAAINLRLNPFFSSISNQAVFLKEIGAVGSKSFQSAPSLTNVVINTATCPANRLLTASSANGNAARYGIAASAFTYDRTFCNYDGEADIDAQTKGEDTSFISRGTVRITGDVTGFAEAGFSRSDRTYRASSRTIAGTAPVNNFLVGGLALPFQAILPIGHPDNPFNGDAVPRAAAVRLRFENFPGGTQLRNEQYRGLAGLKGTVGTWDWETAVLWNRTERTETSYGFLYLPTLRQAFENPIPANNRTLASIASDPTLSPALTNKAYAEILQYDGKITTEFGALPGGPIGFATGFEFREESIHIDPDPKNAAGQILGLSNTIIDGSRKVKSAFFEFRTPFLTNYEMDFAGRFDSYPGIKTNFVPKVGAKWTVVDGLAFRGAYAEGFRAPAVSQVSPGGAQFFINGLVDPLRCEEDGVTPKPGGATTADCSKSVSGVGGQNPDLKPEKSKSYSLGFIYSPTSNIDLLVDWYKIRKVGEVALGSAQDVIDHPDRYPPSALTRDTNPALLLNGVAGTGPLLAVSLPWSNQGSTEVSGIDLELKVRASLGEWGKLTSRLRGTYQLKYLREEIVGLPTYNVVGTNGGLSDWATSVGDIPRVKLRFESSLEQGGHQFTGAVNYVSSISEIRRYDGTIPKEYSGSTCHYGGTNFDAVTGRSVLGAANAVVGGQNNGRQLYVTYHPDCTVPAWTTYDLGYSYSGIKDLTVGVTVQNILDTKAPYQPTTNGSATALDGYNSGLHNNLGRYFTFSANYKFK